MRRSITPRLSRRHFCAAASAFLSNGARAESAATARTADAFIDSVGVCVHLAAEPYNAGFARFSALLGNSGIRHIREELRPADDLRRWHDLQETAGINWHLLASPTTNTAQQALQRISALGREHVSAVEGQNEGDGTWFKAQAMVKGNWSGAVIAYQRDLYRAVRGAYTAAVLPVVSPSLLDWRPLDVPLIEDAAAFCDVVSLHAYVQHAQEPETHASNAALSWYVRNYLEPFKPGAPMMVTETGYSNVVTPGGRGLSELASSLYLPRLLLHNFNAGVVRTFLYEFMDGGRDRAETEHHYGLVRYDGTPKPAYHAVRALLAALQDGGGAIMSPATAQGQTLRVTDAPPDLRQQALRLRDGRVVLALWRPLPVWDVTRAEDIAASSQPVSIISSRPAIRAEYLVPNDGTGWSTLAATDGKITLPVGARVTLLRLT